MEVGLLGGPRDEQLSSQCVDENPPNSIRDRKVSRAEVNVLHLNWEALYSLEACLAPVEEALALSSTQID